MLEKVESIIFELNGLKDANGNIIEGLNELKKKTVAIVLTVSGLESVEKILIAVLQIANCSDVTIPVYCCQ
jgi:hypothetical protein